MKTFLTYFALFLAVYVVASCNSLGNKKSSTVESKIQYSHDTVSFATKIKKVDSAIIDLTNVSDLLIFPDFKDIFNDPQYYFREATSFMEIDSISKQQQYIAMYSMYGNDFKKYLELSNICYSKFKNHRIDEQFLEDVFFIRFGYYSTPLVKHYKEKEVIQFLSRIKNDKMVSSQFEKLIDEVLAGKTFSMDNYNNKKGT